MSLGIGRPAKHPEIYGVRELSRAELADLRPTKEPAVKVLRDSHHMLARLFAFGLRPGEVARKSGYSLARVSVLHNDPAFQELIASYRESVNEAFSEQADEYFDIIASNRIKAARLISDKLDMIEDPNEVSFTALNTIHADAADRTGYPKRREAVNINVDFAARLENAINRSNRAKDISPKVIDAKPVASSADGLAGEGVSAEASSPPLRRRFA